MNVTYRLYRGGSNSVSMQSSKHGSNHSCSLSCSPAEAVKGEKEDGREREKEGGRERERESGRGREKERGREREKDGGRYRRGDRDSGKGKGEGGKEFGKDRERGRERDKSQLLSQYNILSQCQPSSQSQPQYFSEGQGQGQCFSPDVEFIAEDDATCLLRQSSGDFTPLSQHEGRQTEPVSDHARNSDALLGSIPSPLSSPISLSYSLCQSTFHSLSLSLSYPLSLSLSVTLTLSISFYFLSVTQDRIWPTRHRSSKHTRNYNHNRSSTPHRPSQSHQHTPYTYTSQPSAFSLPDLERLNRDEERNSDSDSDNDINNDQYHIHNNDDDDDDDDDNNSDTSSDFYSINSVTPQPDLLHANLSTDSTFNAFQDLDLDLGMGIGLQDYNGTNPGVCPFLFNLSSSFFYLICFPPSFVKSIFFLFV